jgi:mobilization protein NikA
VPAVIHLPDQSQPVAERAPPRAYGRHTGKMKGRHFGPRPVKEPRNAWLTSRCTPAFLAKVRADAEAAGLSLSDYLHVELGGARRARRKRGPDDSVKAQILAALGRSGNNLNQIARAFNGYEFRGIPEMMQMHRAIMGAVSAHHTLVEAILVDMGL